MKHFFLDTNILLDFLIDRKPFADQAALLFQAAADSKVKLYVAAISFNNIYYIVRQVHAHAKTIGLLKTLAEYVEIVAIDGVILNKAIASDFKDFEDGIQGFAAESVAAIELIVTRNIKDFKKSNLPVFSPESAAELLNL
ncbi:type II toxin-antitoxin system VapC family toxin [Botryobacter ruber]|uniref:type II toxin-antitoxin system VapC family toxin n=1 Tax=Botryobacter ruber TaxID=2171629 RepID=UPI000E0BCE47|nr:PIN domain-containing protein [Botryobacter ruber]